MKPSFRSGPIVLLIASLAALGIFFYKDRAKEPSPPESITIATSTTIGSSLIYIAQIARKILNSFRKPVVLNRHELNITTSIGISIYPDDRAIISAVTSMARQMRIKTVAEGVETEEQFAFVKEAGCDEVQGFLVSRPLPAERFRELVAAYFRREAGAHARSYNKLMGYQYA